MTYNWKNPYFQRNYHKDEEPIAYIGRFTPFRGKYHYYKTLSRHTIEFVLPLMTSESSYAIPIFVNSNNETNKKMLEIKIPHNKYNNIYKHNMLDFPFESDLYTTLLDPEYLRLKLIIETKKEKSNKNCIYNAYLVADNANNVNLNKYIYIYYIGCDYNNSHTGEKRKSSNKELKSIIFKCRSSKNKHSLIIFFICINSDCQLIDEISDTKLIRIESKDSEHKFEVINNYTSLGFFSWISSYTNNKNYLKANPVNIPVIYVLSNTENENIEKIINVKLKRGFIYEASIGSIIKANPKTKKFIINFFAPSSQLISILHRNRNNNQPNVEISLNKFPAKIIDNVSILDINLDLSHIYKQLKDFYKKVLSNALSILGQKEIGKNETDQDWIERYIDPRVSLKVFTFSLLYNQLISLFDNKKDRDRSVIWLERIGRLSHINTEIFPKISIKNPRNIYIDLIAKYNPNNYVEIVKKAIDLIRSKKVTTNNLKIHASIVAAIIMLSISNPKLVYEKKVQKLENIASSAADITMSIGLHGLAHIIAEAVSKEYDGNFLRELILSEADYRLFKRYGQPMSSGHYDIELIEGTLGFVSRSIEKPSNNSFHSRILLSFNNIDNDSFSNDIVRISCKLLEEKNLYHASEQYGNYFKNKLENYIKGAHSNNIILSIDDLNEILNNITLGEKEENVSFLLAPPLAPSRGYVLNEAKNKVKDIYNKNKLRSELKWVIDKFTELSIPKCFDSCNACVGNRQYCSFYSKWVIDSLASNSIARFICNELKKGVIASEPKF
ncbi:MAG: hypothetical protein G5Z42_00105 [Caldisphaeraceae archaeon]|nr:hypothetical protein [Caldisphaeraceae archaeon]